MHAKAENERVTAAGPRCRQTDLKNETQFHFVRGTPKHCIKKRAACAARLFFLIQPIK